MRRLVLAACAGLAALAVVLLWIALREEARMYEAVRWQEGEDGMFV